VSSSFDGISSAGFRLRGVPKLDRIRDTLQVHWAKRLSSFAKQPTATSVEIRRNFWADISQCVGRKTSTSGPTFGLPGALCTSSLWFSFEADCCLDGTDVLAIQGWPKAVAEDDFFNSSQKRELGGEGFNLGSFAMVFYAVSLNPFAPWWQA
jgi:hypothetical protein